MPKTASQISEKYQRNVAAAGPSYIEGVKSPKRSWSEGYKSAESRMARGYQQALAQGKMRAGVDRVGDSGWSRAAQDKSSRYTEAAGRAAQAYAQVAQKIVDAGESGRAAAMALPGDTLDSRYARVRANGEAIAKSWGKR